MLSGQGRVHNGRRRLVKLSGGAPQSHHGHTQQHSGSKKHAGNKGHSQAQGQTPAANGKHHAKHSSGPGAGAGSSGGSGKPPSFFDALPGPSSTTGVPNFVIDQFRIPIFLLPIYQAAGTQYGVRWEVLAAINEIETDYGRNLSVSSAGALGWMQFMPGTWKTYGVDANKDGKKDPYNPVDAIFAAARYLKAAGGDKNVRQGIFAYNHAG